VTDYMASSAVYFKMQ